MKMLFKEPFRLFFPLAIIQLIIGVAIWIPQFFSPEYYPTQLHRSLVINGYLYSMILGFLLTALPQFTKSSETTKIEFSLAFILALAPSYAGFMANAQTLSIISLLQASFLIFYVLKRFVTMKTNPPYSFIFMPVALLLWCVADLRHLFLDDPASLLLFYEAATMAFIIAIGTRLVPGLLGHQEIVDYQRGIYETQTSFLKMIPKGFLLMTIVYGLSAFSFERDLSFLRVGVLTSIALSYWRIFSLPTEKTSYAWSVWLCIWGILITSYLKLFFPEYGIHISHGYFLMAIVLLSLLVGTRVVRAHYIKDSQLEKSRLLYVLVGLLFLAAATRVTAPLLARGYENHLAYSSIVLISSSFLWIYLVWIHKVRTKKSQV